MDDDDFAEFGGFEAAEPVEDRPAAQVQGQASPWLAFASGSAQDRPDLLCAQNRFPTYLDPSDISGASASSVNGDDVELPPNGPNADLLDGALFGENGVQLNQAQIAENVLDGTLNAGVAPFHPNQNVNGRLPDIGLGINENRLFVGQPVLNGPQALDLPAAAPSFGQVGGLAEDVLPGVPEEVELRENDANIQQDIAQVVAQEVLPEVEDPAPVVRAQERLQEQLENLQARNRVVEEELQQKQEELTTQRTRLEEVEQQHTETLGEVRKAGHDVLSLVVEQYKEQTKTVIIEQQEAAKLQLLETLTEQMKAFQDLLSLQKQNFADERESEREEVKGKIDTAVEEACRKEQEKFQVFLHEQEEKWRCETSRALEEERAACQEKIQEAVKTEHETAKNRLDEARAEYASLLEEEKKIHEAALAKVREEEVEKAKEQMCELVREERERNRESMQQAMETVRTDMRTYVEQQQQADSRIRQRHLTSLDLFLESAKHQISLLMDSEKQNLSADASGSKES